MTTNGELHGGKMNHFIKYNKLKQNKTVLFIIAMIGLFIYINSSLSNIKQNTNNSALTFRQSSFIYDIYNMTDSSRNKNNLHIYWEFVNDILQFIKQSDHQYKAEYELSIEILDQQENYITGRSLQNTVFVADYLETNSNEFSNRGNVTFVAKPGKHFLRIELIDLDTQKRMILKNKIQVQQFSVNQTASSDLIYLDKFDSTLTLSNPNLTANFKDSISAGLLYYEIYPTYNCQTVTAIMRIFDSFKREVNTCTTNSAADQKIIFQLFDLKKVIRKPGRYSVELSVFDGKKWHKKESYFFMNWHKYSFSIDNLDKAIEPLEIFGNITVFENIEKLSSLEKRKKFEAFWGKRDPTPETAANELMDEFYSRVKFSNQKFTVHIFDKLGWKTDRGRILIQFGKPAIVENQTSDLNRPAYEIWIYDKIQKRFIFKDSAGLGDYKLLKIE